MKNYRSKTNCETAPNCFNYKVKSNLSGNVVPAIVHYITVLLVLYITSLLMHLCCPMEALIHTGQGEFKRVWGYWNYMTFYLREKSKSVILTFQGWTDLKRDGLINLRTGWKRWISTYLPFLIGNVCHRAASRVLFQAIICLLWSFAGILWRVMSWVSVGAIEFISVWFLQAGECWGEKKAH